MAGPSRHGMMYLGSVGERFVMTPRPSPSLPAASPARPAARARPAAGPPTAMPAWSRGRASAPAAARPPGAGRHARALLVGVAPALLARGLDLRQEGLVLRPLHGNLLADELLDGLDL